MTIVKTMMKRENKTKTNIQMRSRTRRSGMNLRLDTCEDWPGQEIKGRSHCCWFRVQLQLVTGVWSEGRGKGIEAQLAGIEQGFIQITVKSGERFIAGWTRLRTDNKRGFENNWRDLFIHLRISTRLLLGNGDLSHRQEGEKKYRLHAIRAITLLIFFPSFFCDHCSYMSSGDSV